MNAPFLPGQRLRGIDYVFTFACLLADLLRNQTPSFINVYWQDICKSCLLPWNDIWV